MIKLWSDKNGQISEAELLALVASMEFQGSAPLSPDTIDLLADISVRILSSDEGRKSAQLVALGYWLRRASLTRMVERLNIREEESLQRVPRGIAFHLPPTNVDTIFVYSWALSVLAGNCNIVRLPSAPDNVTQWLTTVITDALGQAGQSHRHMFCSFPKESRLLAGISALSDLRMIWGGDAKVKAVSALPTRPDGLSLGFPDRTSIAVINLARYRSANDGELEDLAAGLYNDIFWFDQMGCGSPRIVIWIGEGDFAASMLDLSTRLDREARKRGTATATAVAIHKIHGAAAALADGTARRAIHVSNALEILEATRPIDALEQRVGGGFLYYAQLMDIAEIGSLVSRKVQTITHYGFDRAALGQLAVAIAGRGGYRLVKPGRALQFDAIWDGLDLFGHMTRLVQVEY